MYAPIKRLARVARRFVASGQLSSSPVPIIKRAFNGREAFFIQVGSNDGLSGDPLHDLILVNPLWRGIFIEPVGYAFKRLTQNYGGSERFIFEQIAVADEAGEREFYYVSEQGVQVAEVPLSDKLGSFDRSHIINHSPLLEKYIISHKVPCEPLESIIKRHSVTNIDIIHIDVEGYDYRVLCQIDFNIHSPRLILFEHAHLNKDDYSRSSALLKSHGYRIINCGLDTLAISSHR